MKVILVGKSHTGKDYIAKKLKEKGYKVAVFHTSRPKRIKEKNGIDYHFVSKKQFRHIDFLDKQTYNNWYYGITKDEYENADIVIMTPANVKNIFEKEKRENVLIILLDIPLKLLIERMEKRLDTDDKIRRLKADEIDFNNFDQYDLKLYINEENALDKVLPFIKKKKKNKKKI